MPSQVVSAASPAEARHDETRLLAVPVDRARESAAAPSFLTAFAVVTAGCAAVDYTRLPLLFIPVSCWLASLGAARMLEAWGGALMHEEPPGMLRHIVRLIVGVACLSLVAVVTGMLGLLPIAGLTAVGCAAVEVVALLRSGARTPAARPGFSQIMAAIPFGILGLLGWLWATVPPTFYDELAYHLVVPDRAVATGALPLYPWVFFNVMPHVSDVLLSWGVVWAGGIGARAMHWGLWALCLAAAWGGSAAVLGRRTSPWLSWLLTLALASSPTFWFLGTLPFSETTMTLGLLGVLIAVAPPSDRKPWLAVGCLLGLMAAAKLTGIAWALSALAALKVLGWSWAQVGRVSAVTALWMLPWWSRAYLATGDPLYPLLWRWLGSTQWSEASQTLAQGDLPPALTSLGLTDAVRLPWDIVLHPERFASAGDVGLLAVVCVGLMLLLPAAVRLLPTQPHDRTLADAGACFVVLSGFAWLASSTTTRFYSPAFFVCIALAAGLTGRLGRRAVLIAAASILPLCVTGSMRFFETHESVFESTHAAFGREDRDRYVARTVGYYEAAQFVNKELPSDARLLFVGEFRSYYFNRAALAPSPYDRHPLESWVQAARSPEDIARRLAEEGITHVVLNSREFARLQKHYRILTFAGPDAADKDRLLRMMPRALDTLYADGGLYVLRVPPLGGPPPPR